MLFTIKAAHTYSLTIEEAKFEQEILFWDAIAEGVARMRQFNPSNTRVNVAISGLLGNRVAFLDFTCSTEIPFAAFGEPNGG